MAMDQEARIRTHPGKLTPSDSRDDPTCLAPGIAIGEEGIHRLQDEGTPSGLNHLSPEKSPQLLPGSTTSQGMSHPPGKEPSPPRLLSIALQLHSDPKEDLIRIRTPSHESDEVLDLLIRDATASPGIFTVSSDLGLHHVGKPESAGKGDGHILVVQDFSRQVLILQSLKQGQRHMGMDPTT
jgi:hypothetical protein